MNDTKNTLIKERETLKKENNIEYYILLYKYLSIEKPIDDILYFGLLINLNVNIFHTKYCDSVITSSHLFNYLNKAFENNARGKNSFITSYFSLLNNFETEAFDSFNFQFSIADRFFNYLTNEFLNDPEGVEDFMIDFFKIINENYDKENFFYDYLQIINEKRSIAYQAALFLVENIIELPIKLYTKYFIVN